MCGLNERESSAKCLAFCRFVNSLSLSEQTQDSPSPKNAMDLHICLIFLVFACGAFRYSSHSNYSGTKES